MNHRGFEPEDIARLERMHSSIASLANRDCYGSSAKDEGQKCDCDTCTAREILDDLNGVLDPVLSSLQPSRMTNPAERIYVELWRKQNERKGWINSGYTLLEHILCPDGQKRPSPVNQRDGTVATSVIQWLGTNCGHGFMEEAERRIREARITRQVFRTDGLGNDPAAWLEAETKGPIYVVAEQIASNFCWIPRVRDALRHAIINAIISFLRGKHRDKKPPRLIRRAMDIHGDEPDNPEDVAVIQMERAE